MAECMWLHLSAVMYFLSPGVLLKDLLIDTGFVNVRERDKIAYLINVGMLLNTVHPSLRV